MEVSNYIFLTSEGETMQPETTDSEQYQSRDIENLQVIGIAKGINAKEAYHNLLKENTNLKETSFNELIAWKLADDFQENQEYFYLKS